MQQIDPALKARWESLAHRFVELNPPEPEHRPVCGSTQKSQRKFHYNRLGWGELHVRLAR